MKPEIRKKKTVDESVFRKRYAENKRKRDIKRVKSTGRHVTMILFFCGLLVAVTINCFRVMILDSNKIMAKAKVVSDKHQNNEVLIPDRGIIKDRTGRVLVDNAITYDLTLDVKTLDGLIEKQLIENIEGYKELSKEERVKKKEELEGPREVELKRIIHELAKVLDKDPEKLAEKLMTKRSNGEYWEGLPIAQSVTPGKLNQVKDILGEKTYPLIKEKKTNRIYPNGNIAPHVIGELNVKNIPQSGIELCKNSALSGVIGRRTHYLDKKGNEMPKKEKYTRAVDGDDITLTIDANIQRLVDKYTEQALIDNSALKVSIIVTEPKTGRILALSNKPDFDIRDSYDENQNFLKNRVINEAFEPGSVFKPFTAYAALDSGVTYEGEIVPTKGYKNVMGIEINNWDRKAREDENMEIALKESSNTYFANMALRMGKQTMNEYIELFGFGKITGTDIGYEGTGVLMDINQMTELDLATISFGQTNSMTMIQYIRAFNGLINGGYLITPHAIKDIERENDYESKYITGEQNLNEDVCNRVKVLLESVGKKALPNIEAYRPVCKTGTAQKVENGKYKDKTYISSMAVAFPAEDPLISIMISIDEPNPKKYYAGVIIPPVASGLINEIIEKLRMTDERMEDLASSVVEVPDVNSETVKDAIKILTEAELSYKLVGNGKYVSHIKPAAGNLVRKGKVIEIVTFD